jgi:gamma-glutamyltranspeptidase/glutathione hydrolase
MKRNSAHFVRRAALAAISFSSSLLVVGHAAASDRTVVAKHGMVVAGHPLAVESGIRALRAGGTACDAAVATAATLSVMMPDMMGPAGSGFALLWDANKKDLSAIDYNGVAPKATDAAQYTLEKKLRGFWAPTVPANLKGWEAVHRKCGKLKWSSLWSDAIEYAEKGRPMDFDSSFHTRRHVTELGIYEGWAKEFLIDGQAPAQGSLLVRKDLANSYKQFAQMGSKALYGGPVGDKLVAYMKKNGGLISKEDLLAYKVVWRKPLESTYRGLTVYGAPPPSAAITWMQMLAILEGYDLKALKHNSFEYLNTMVEVSKHAYLDSYRYVSDPAFVKIPVDKMLSREYAGEIRQKIAQGRFDMKTVKQAVLDLPSKSATSHMSVVDRWGNAVSMTNTLGNFWGSGIVAEGTGLLLSNGMDWFDIDENVWTGEKPGNQVMAPGKRNRWTLAPGMVFKDSKLYMVVGGAGAESTMYGIAQPIVNIVDFGMDAFAAVSAPRILWGDTYHYTGGTEVHLQAGIPEEIRAKMKAAGHNVPDMGKQRNAAAGTTNLIVIDPASRTYSGAAARNARDFVSGY